MPLTTLLGLLATVILAGALTVGVAQWLGLPLAALGLLAVLASLWLRRR